MGKIAVIIFTLCVVMAVDATGKDKNNNVKNAPKLFDNFVRKYNKNYDNKKDRETHYRNFVNNLKDLDREQEKRKNEKVRERIDKHFDQRRQSGRKCNTCRLG